jgi:hypothetical protein
MPGLINAGGTWKTLSSALVNAGGTWRSVSYGLVNAGGTWKQFFSLAGYYVLDNTQNPGLPHNVSIIDNGNNTFYGSWTSGGNTSSYNYSFTGTPLSNNTTNTYTPNQSFSSSATKYIYVNAVNGSHVPTVYWSVISGASTYTITYTVNGGSPNYYTTAGSSGGTGILYANLGNYFAGDIINVTSVVSNTSYNIPASGATSVTFGANTVSDIATGSGTVTYHVVSYTVTFDANGGSGTMSSQSSSSATALNSNTFTYTDRTFNGWNTAINGSGTSYANGATYPFTSSTTLYAQWSVNTPTQPTLTYVSSTTSSITATVNFGSYTNGCYIYYSTSFTLTPATSANYSGLTTSNGGNYTVTGLSSGVTYYIYAVPYNSATTGTFNTLTANTTITTSPPSTPGTPSLTYISANGSTSWNYSATWAASTGTAPITYYLRAYGSSDGYVTQQTLKGSFSSTSSVTFTLPQTSLYWKVSAYATNSAGTSSNSGLSNSA